MPPHHQSRAAFDLPCCVPIACVRAPSCPSLETASQAENCDYTELQGSLRGNESLPIYLYHLRLADTVRTARTER